MSTTQRNGTETNNDFLVGNFLRATSESCLFHLSLLVIPVWYQDILQSWSSHYTQGT